MKKPRKADFVDVCERTIAILEAWSNNKFGANGKACGNQAKWMRERLGIKGEIIRPK